MFSIQRQFVSNLQENKGLLTVILTSGKKWPMTFPFFLKKCFSRDFLIHGLEQLQDDSCGIDGRRAHKLIETQSSYLVGIVAAAA